MSKSAFFPLSANRLINIDHIVDINMNFIDIIDTIKKKQDRLVDRDSLITMSTGEVIHLNAKQVNSLMYVLRTLDRLISENCRLVNDDLMEEYNDIADQLKNIIYGKEGKTST